MRKRPLILLEILIGLGLAGLLLSLLFCSLVDSSRMGKQFEQVREKVLERQRVQMRLQDLFLNLATGSSSPLFTEKFPDEKKESLVLLFDNGIDPDPAYSGLVTGKLYLDEGKNFSLVIWPLEPPGRKKTTQRKWRKEVLLPQIQSFQFEFLGEKKKPTDKAITTNLAWHLKWESERASEIPSQIRLKIQEKNNTELQFAFSLALPPPIPTYREKT